MNLGNLIDTLSVLDPALPVEMDGESGLGFISWRGCYHEASLDHGATDMGLTIRRESYESGSWDEATTRDRIAPAETVGDLLAAAERLAEGGYLEGYKGGWYPMRRDTALWADEWGRYSGRTAAGVLIIDGCVVIQTAESAP